MRANGWRNETRPSKRRFPRPSAVPRRGEDECVTQGVQEVVGDPAHVVPRRRQIVHADERTRDILGRGPDAFEPETLLNVNLPSGPVRGLRPTSLGRRIYRDQVAVRKDLRGKDYYWIGGPEEKGPDIPGSDCTAIAEGLVSVTALGLDLTHQPTLDRLAAWWPGERLGS